MKNQPTNQQLAQIFLFGLGLVSFGFWFIWLPIIGWSMLFVGAIFILLFVVTIVTMILGKMIK